MTSANLPINLETTPLFKDYVSNVKKQLVQTKQNSESKRQVTRLQVARKSTSWHRLSRMSPTRIESTAASPTPVISGATVNSTSILSPICEGENGKENDQDEKNGEKERARSDGTNSPVNDHHDVQVTSNSLLHNQHSPKDITEDEEKEKEEKGNQEENEDLCKQSSKVTSNNMTASAASTSAIIDTGDKTASISTLACEFDKTNKLDHEHSIKIEEEEQTQNEDSSSSINQHFNQLTSSNKKSHHNHEYNHLHENKKEDPDKEKKEEKEKDLSKQSSKATSDSMATATLSTLENTETTDSTTSVPFEGAVNIKQQKEQDKKSEEKEKFKRKLSYDNTEHVSREKTVRNCSPPPASFKEEDKTC